MPRTEWEHLAELELDILDVLRESPLHVREVRARLWSGQDLTNGAVQEMILDYGYLPLPIADRAERRKSAGGKRGETAL